MSYSHLTYSERNVIWVLHFQGHRPCDIARATGRPRCTIHRELERNRSCEGSYGPATARVLARKMPDKRAATANAALGGALARVPAHQRHTLTVDNGKEFARFKTLQARCGLGVLAVGVHSSPARSAANWKKGTSGTKGTQGTTGCARRLAPFGPFGPFGPFRSPPFSSLRSLAKAGPRTRRGPSKGRGGTTRQGAST